MKLNFVAMLLVVLVVDSGTGYAVDQRIYKGDLAKMGQFPYVAEITQYDAEGKTFGCTGSLISDRWVVVAAHCARGTERAEVYLGTVSTTIFNFTGQELLYHVEKKDIHIFPNYSTTKFNNDLALYHLSDSVPLEETQGNIEAINFVKKSKNNPTLFDNKNATIIGWGFYDNNKTTNDLRYATNVNVMPHAKCAKFIKKFYKGSLPLDDGQVCADKTRTKKGACPGDSGGPLVVADSDNNPLLIGAASYITGNCSNQNPVVYAFIGYYLDWIHDITGLPVD